MSPAEDSIPVYVSGVESRLIKNWLCSAESRVLDIECVSPWTGRRDLLKWLTGTNGEILCIFDHVVSLSHCLLDITTILGKVTACMTKENWFQQRGSETDLSPELNQGQRGLSSCKFKQHNARHSTLLMLLTGHFHFIVCSRNISKEKISNPDNLLSRPLNIRQFGLSTLVAIFENCAKSSDRTQVFLTALASETSDADSIHHANCSMLQFP